ncbi:hypothetical protein C3R30_21465, partial [Mycobacterium tuberculosis]
MGPGGLAWAAVAPRLVSAFPPLPAVAAVLSPPSGGSRALAGVAGLRLPWGRAVLLAALRRSLPPRRALAPWAAPAGLSPLALPPLLSFAPAAAPALALAFPPGRSG